MNKLELRMVDLLKELKELHGAVSVRAEFEAEGTKLEELLRLKEISATAGLGLTLKIGGCESVRDILEARVVGVNHLVAPMVESAYALRKYLQAVNKFLLPEEKESVEILCNIETATAVNGFDEMLQIPEIDELDGIVIERVDLCYSLGMQADWINSPKINDLVMLTLEKARKKNLVCTVGGGMSAESIPFFKEIPEGLLHRYETRKVSFSWPGGHNGHREKAILKGLGFEVLWLRNKLSFYKNISVSDQERMNLLEQRYWQAIDSLG